MACHVARALLAVLLFCISALLVAGCESDTPEEAAYKTQIQAVRTRWNAIKDEVEAYSDQYTQQMGVTSSLQGATTLFHGFQQRLQGSIGQLHQLQSDLLSIQPPARFTANHTMMINGVGMVMVALSQMNLTVGTALRPGADIDAIETQLEAQAESGVKGEEAFIEGASAVLPMDWPVVIGFFIGWLVVGSICGYISGRIGQIYERRFGGYFCLGFFLGLIGILIAFLTAWGRRPRVRDFGPPVMDGYAHVPAPAPVPIQPPQHYGPDFYAPQDFAPAYDDYTGVQPPIRPTVFAGPVPAASDTSLVRCPNCGASWTPDYIFCGDCGTPIQQL